MIDERAIGRFSDRHTIVFEVLYPQPPSEVWRAITDPVSIVAWFAYMELEPWLGGRVTLDPRHDRSVDTGPAGGAVVAFDAERVLAYRFPAGQPMWPESELRFELRATGDSSSLVFSQRLASDVIFIDADQLAGPGTFPPGTCASWQCILQDGLATFLTEGRSPGYDEWDDVLPSLTNNYRDLIITALLTDDARRR